MRHGTWDEDLKNIRDIYLQSRGAFLVCEPAPEICSSIIAMGALKPIDAIRGEIKRMRVHPLFQRQGFGSLILQKLEEKAEEFGYRMLQLDTAIFQKPEPAIGLYTKFGYRETRRELQGGYETVFFEKKQ